MTGKYSMWIFLWCRNTAKFKQTNDKSLKSINIHVDYLEPWLTCQTTECNVFYGNYYKTASIKINYDRMKSALSAESFAMPQGLSREEMRGFILEAGKSNCHTLQTTNNRGNK